MKLNESDTGRRLGAAVRRARLDQAFTSREDFARHCHVSPRLLADLETGARTNFSCRIVSRLETGLGWPAGTIANIASDPTFDPPAAGRCDNWAVQPPAFNRRPIRVDVALIEQAITVLSTARDTADGTLTRLEAAMAKALLDQAWPYATRLLEDNSRPGRGLHPGARPFYETFIRISDWLAPREPAAHYARWLVGDVGNLDEATLKIYTRRWSATRRTAGVQRLLSRGKLPG
jgi:hypothetical protein